MSYFNYDTFKAQKNIVERARPQIPSPPTWATLMNSPYLGPQIPHLWIGVDNTSLKVSVGGLKDGKL